MAEGPDVGPAHRPALDGLRGLAVVVVVAYHLGYLRGGFLGVDVFFVLSGYLITTLVLHEAESTGGVSLVSFWGRRIRRLVPALVVMVVAVVGAAIAIGWPRSQLRSLSLDAVSTLTWWANWRQVGGTSYWDDGENLFRHAWSLSIEEQFYVVWPLVVVATVALARRFGRTLRTSLGLAAAAGAALSAGWMVVLSNRLDDADLSRAYVGTDTRVFAPLVGCALACALGGGGARRAGRTRLVSVVGWLAAAVLAVMVATVEVSSTAMYRRGGFVLVALAAALVLWGALDIGPGRPGPGAAVLANPLVTHLGTRSYAIYLWSWPIQVLTAFRWPGLRPIEVAAITVAATMVLAEASFHLVERPVRRRTGWAAASGARRPAWAVGGIAALALVSLAWIHGEPQPLHERVDAADVARQALEPVEPVVPADPATGPDDPATGPDDRGPAGDLRVMVTGDSIAWTVGYYAPGGDDLPPGIAGIDSRALIGCGLLAAEGWKYPQGSADGPFREPAGSSCSEQIEAERIGLEGRPDVVVLFPGAWEGIPVQSPDGQVIEARSAEMEAILTDRLLARIGAADAVGARYALVEWICPGSEVSGARADPVYITWINGLLADVARRARAELGAEVAVIAPTDDVCVDGDPLADPTDAKVAATGDEVHVVTPEGGRWIWHEWLAPALRRS